VPWVAAGIGTLVKGPLAAVLVLGPLAVAAAIRRPRPALAELGVARGLAVATAIAAALYVPVGVLDPSYLDAFAATNLRRWGESSPHAAGPHYYAFWVPVLFLPWTLLAGPAVVRAWRDPGRRALVAWALFVPALLTLPRGKLATYALSALVPLALVAGPDLARTALEGAPREDRRVLRVGGALMAGALVVMAVLAVAVRTYPVPTAGRLAVAGTALAWAVVLALVVRGERLGGVPVAVLGAMLTLCPLAVRSIVPAVGALHSDRDLARLAADGGSAPVIAFGIRDPSLSLYLGSPALHTDDPALLRDLFASDGPTFVVTSHRHFTEVETMLGDRASLWAETPRRRLYANRPPPATQDRNGSR
jgi:4-amino-4-deoxy-L-arabinose transferase-like glycosyltransferase